MTTPIHIKGITKRYGEAVALNDVHLDIGGGELFFLLGPSGCGKTTLLRSLAGFVVPDSGDIFFGEERITDMPPRSRDAALVFQTYALWPHMSVADNVAYGLHVRGLGRQEIRTRVDKALRMVRMETYGERKPTQLSGGQQQRIALARALVINPRVLLLDEPLSNLDARLRDEMREEIRRLHAETGLTMVYVTHDQKEALSLASRMAVMERGQLAQVGTAREVYDRPASQFIAQFLGDSNFLTGTTRQVSENECVVETALGNLTGIPSQDRINEGAKVICSIRPPALAINPTESLPNRFSARVKTVAFLGELQHVEVIAGETPLQIVALAHSVSRLKAGDEVIVSVATENVVLLTR